MVTFVRVLLKRLFILFWLSTAYIIVLAHSFIPHGHKAESVLQDHHDEDHQHDHDTREDHSPQDIFRFFQHNEVTGNSFLQVKKIEFSFEKKLLVQSVFIVALFQLPATEGPPLTLHNKGSDLFILPTAKAYFFLLKAPPGKTSLA